MTRKRRTKSNGKRKSPAYFGIHWPTLNRALTGLEHQAERAYKQVKTWPNDLQKVLSNDWTTRDLIEYAAKQRDNVEHEVRRIAKDIVHTLKEAHFLSKKERLVRDAQKNLEVILKKVRKNPMVVQAKDLAVNQSGHLLEALNVPSRKDVSLLNNRLSQIEKRLTQYT